MSKAIGLIYAIALGTLTACGHSDATTQTSPSQATTPDTSGYIGGNCADSVVRAYDSVNLTCQRDAGGKPGRVDDTCRTEAQNFLNSYAGASCAIVRRGARAGARNERIEAHDIQALIDGRR